MWCHAIGNAHDISKPSRACPAARGRRFRTRANILAMAAPPMNVSGTSTGFGQWSAGEGITLEPGSRGTVALPKLCAFFRSESCVSSQSEGGLKQTPCKLLIMQGLLCIKSHAQDYLWIASLEAAFLLGF